MTTHELLTQRLGEGVNRRLVSQLEDIHRVQNSRNCQERKLSSAINLFTFKHDDPGEFWPELILFTRFVEPSSREGLEYFTLIHKMAQHGFHSSKIYGCEFCRVLGHDQDANKKFLLNHYRHWIRELIMDSLTWYQRLQVHFKSDDLNKVIFAAFAGIIFSTLINNFIRLLEEADNGAKQRDLRRLALLGAIELGFLACLIFVCLAIKTTGNAVNLLFIGAVSLVVDNILGITVYRTLGHPPFIDNFSVFAGFTQNNSP